MSISSNYYTVKEMANILGVHPTTIIRSIKYGRIAAFRVGSGKKASYRILKVEIKRMAEFDLETVIKAEVEKRLKERK